MDKTATMSLMKIWPKSSMEDSLTGIKDRRIQTKNSQTWTCTFPVRHRYVINGNVSLVTSSDDSFKYDLKKKHATLSTATLKHINSYNLHRERDSAH